MRSAYLSIELMLVVDSQEINEKLKGHMKEYEKEAILIIDEDNVFIPEGVTRQSLTSKRKIRIWMTSLLNWLRFLF